MLGATCIITLGGHSNTIKPASWLVQVLCDFMTMNQEAAVSLEYTMTIHLVGLFYFLVQALPPSCYYILGIYFLVIQFTKSKFMAGSIPVPNLPEKNVFILLPGIYLLSYSI